MMEKSIVEFKLLSEKEKRVLLLLNYISSRNPFLLNIEAKINQMHFHVEKIISEHHPADTPF